MRFIAATLFVISTLALGTQADAQVDPFRSWSKLSWSNGFAPGYFDLEQRRVVAFREHLYAAFDENTTTRDLLYDMYFGIRLSGANRWLTDVAIDAAGYDGDTGMVRVVQSVGDVRLTQYFFGPFDSKGPAMIAAIEVENLGGSVLADAAIFSIQNMHIGGGSGTSSESIQWHNGAFEERGPDGRLIVHRPVPSPSIHGATPHNPWQRVAGGMRLVSVDDSGVTDDAVAGFEWDLSGLEPGATRTFAVAIGYDAGGDRQRVDTVLAPSLGPDAGSTIGLARDDWAAYQGQAIEPPGMSEDERKVYRRALAVLRMSQVREGKPSQGQIVASMPPGMWNIAWVRDQAYAIDGLIAAGLHSAARDALGFILEGDAGDYICCDQSGGPYVGRDYAISVTRYYGNGREESDWNHNGPNVEFDGFGMTLRNLERYVLASGDHDFIDEHAQAIFEGTADVLVSLIEEDTGLIRADSSIWETHWENGGRRHHTYTQVAAVAGLRSAAALAGTAGRTEDAGRYREAAETVATAVRGHLVDPSNSVLRSSLEERHSYLDGAVIEAFNWGALPAQGEVANATLDAFRQGLWNSDVGRGYRRSDDGDAYDEREWVIVDLRIAAASRRAGRTDHADEIVDWITGQARMNFDIIPENFNRHTGAFEGEVPMAGFGAGVYVSAMWERGAPDENPGGEGGDAGADDEVPGPGAPSPAGCGCQSSGQSPLGLGLLVLAFAAATRRRRRAASSTVSCG